MDIERALERTNRILTVDNDKIKTQIYVSDLKAVLNELDKKDKIIKLMANEIYITAIRDDGTHFSTRQEVIDYFTKKVEGE